LFNHMSRICVYYSCNAPAVTVREVRQARSNSGSESSARADQQPPTLQQISLQPLSLNASIASVQEPPPTARGGVHPLKSLPSRRRTARPGRGRRAIPRPPCCAGAAKGLDALACIHGRWASASGAPIRSLPRPCLHMAYDSCDHVRWLRRPRPHVAALTRPRPRELASLQSARHAWC